MAGAAVVGEPVARAGSALNVGCDMVLVCNDAEAAVQLLDQLGDPAARRVRRAIDHHVRWRCAWT